MSTRKTFLALVILVGFAHKAQSQAPADRAPADTRRLVTGPSGPMNDAIAAGATAVVTLQPVAPKTQPPSSYPMGSSIMGQTLSLGSVPARVWIETHVTGWAPVPLKLVQARISATDPEMDGGGYSGAAADCGGSPAGGGDITPAMQACNVNADCRSTMSGLTSACGFGEPSKCLSWNGTSPGNYFPPGNWCEPGFQDKCDAQWPGAAGITVTAAVDISSLNFRYCPLADVTEELPDFFPTYFGTLVLDVPADAKGTYTIDMDETQTYMQDRFSNDVPIAAFRPAVIRIIRCLDHSDCPDGDSDVCTTALCQDGCCTISPVAGWNPETECCHPMTGVQAPIPLSMPCRIGTCSLGGSSGSPTFTQLADGTACTHEDRCYLPGQCSGGTCAAQEYAGSDCLKSRFISYEPFTGSALSAYRVRLVSLHHPDPPYRAGVAADFTAFEGEYRWVGPADTYQESSANPTPIYAATLGCDPHYADWSPFDLLHVTGSAVVPSSVYEVQSIAQGLDLQDEGNYSAAVLLQTDAWGDTVWPYSPPSTTIQPNATDHAVIVDKFRAVTGALSKVRAVMTGPSGSDIPDLDLDVDFAQVSENIDAFKGQAYPFAGPAPCP